MAGFSSLICYALLNYCNQIIQTPITRDYPSPSEKKKKKKINHTKPRKTKTTKKQNKQNNPKQHHKTQHWGLSLREEVIKEGKIQVVQQGPHCIGGQAEHLDCVLRLHQIKP